MLYRFLQHLFPVAEAPRKPRRIVLIRPCCIGDVVMATAALSALREAFPDAHITWAAGAWSARAIAHHPASDSILTIESDMPMSSPVRFRRFVRQLRSGNFDCAVSLARSPLMSLATWLAGIPIRAGLDSGGRGFGYNLRVDIDPDLPEHESQIYLKVVSAIAGRKLRAWANLPVTAAASAEIQRDLKAAAIESAFIVAHPGGGVNPGMRFESKRFPPARFAEVLNRVADAISATVVLLGGPGDAQLVAKVERNLNVQTVTWVDRLTFEQIGALAADALLYIGNDTGLTHLAAASGAKTVMLMGPTDPRRYAPYTADHLALWKPTDIQAGGANAGSEADWNWRRDGINVDDAVRQILDFLRT